MTPKTINIETIQHAISTYYITHVPFSHMMPLPKSKGDTVTRNVTTKKLCNKTDNSVNDLE